MTQCYTAPSQALKAGQVRLRVDSFALTSNNISYAAFGETMNYWRFYPTHAAAWGLIPVWGFATVVESCAQADDLALGDVFYGYYPMASEVVLDAGRISPRGFMDLAPHRAELNAVYNQYHNTRLDPFHVQNNPAAEALLRPLYLTSWLIDDFLADHNFYGANAAILSSASSKTAYGTAFALKQRGAVEVIGLTSAANMAFCQSLGCYDRVVCYDNLGTIAQDTACVYVDFAGHASLRLAVHTRFPALKYSCSVGGTHLNNLGGGKGLPGPRPVLFFAPAQSQKRAAEWGGAALSQRIVADWHAFVQLATAPAAPCLLVQHHAGEVAVNAAYATVLAGTGDARQGHILSLN